MNLSMGTKGVPAKSLISSRSVQLGSCSVELGGILEWESGDWWVLTSWSLSASLLLPNPLISYLQIKETGLNEQFSMGVLLPPGTFWKCVRTFLVIIMTRDCYWHRSGGVRDARHLPMDRAALPSEELSCDQCGVQDIHVVKIPTELNLQPNSVLHIKANLFFFHGINTC